MTHDEMIEVIAAHRDGKKIQAKYQKGQWIDITLPPLWNFEHNEYRIKPEPLTLDQCWHKAMDSKSSDDVLVAFLKVAKENGHV